MWLAAAFRDVSARPLLDCRSGKRVRQSSLDHGEGGGTPEVKGRGVPCAPGTGALFQKALLGSLPTSDAGSSRPHAEALRLPERR